MARFSLTGQPSPGMGFVIETKTLRYSRAHVARTIQLARWLAGNRRQYPHGVMPVVCVTRAWCVECMQHNALVVSLDRLLDALRAAAGRATGMQEGRSAEVGHHRSRPGSVVATERGHRRPRAMQH